MVFADQLSGGALDEEVTLSMLGYDGHRPAQPEDLGLADLGEAHLVGLGAIGNGAIWALSQIPGLSGTLHLVDPESVDLSNLQRYVLPGQAEVEVSKVDVAASAFASGTLKVVPHRKLGRICDRPERLAL
jgi:molybdopterin/thiamine biosynthesis adenylyltransferase